MRFVDLGQQLFGAVIVIVLRREPREAQYRGAVSGVTDAGKGEAAMQGRAQTCEFER